MAEGNQNFASIQEQMRTQMTQQSGESDLKATAKELANASRSMQQQNMSSLQQTNSLVQALQQTQMQIQAMSNAVMALANQQKMAGISPAAMMPPPPMPPPPLPTPQMSAMAGRAAGFGGAALGFIGSSAGGVIAGAGDTASAQLSLARQRAGQFNRMYNPLSGHAQLGSMGGMTTAAPGVLTTTFKGNLHSAYAGLGIAHNPSLAQSYSAGQLQDAHARNFGAGISDTIGGAFSFGAGMTSAAPWTAAAGGFLGAKGGSAAGAWAGGAIGSLIMPGVGTALGAGLGGLAGGFVGAGAGSGFGHQVGQFADKFNPLMWSAGHAGRITGFGAGADAGSHNFLRGAGGPMRVGQLGLTQQQQIGSSIAKTALKDYTFSSSDMMQAQEMFADQGLMLGSQTPEQIGQNFKKRMGDAKQIMKMFNMSIEEAVNFMSQEFSGMGFASGTQASLMRTKILAGAHLAGVGVEDMARIASQGAQAGIGSGIMATGGAQIGVSAAGLAGVAATLGAGGRNGLNANLLATVGGEQGLGDVLAKSQRQFLAGPGGAMMAMGGGMYGTDVMGGLGRMSGGLNSGNIIGWGARQHEMLNDLAQNPELLQAQQFLHIKGLSNQMKSAGGSERDRMMLLAQSQLGLSGADAEAWYESNQSLPDQLRRQKRVHGQAQKDAMVDAHSEQFGIVGRIETVHRGAMRITGMDRLADRATGFQADIGERHQRLVRRLGDKLIGIDDRYSYSDETMEAAISADFSHPGGGGSRANSKVIDAQKHYNNYTDRDSAFSGPSPLSRLSGGHKLKLDGGSSIELAPELRGANLSTEDKKQLIRMDPKLTEKQKRKELALLGGTEVQTDAVGDFINETGIGDREGQLVNRRALGHSLGRSVGQSLSGIPGFGLFGLAAEAGGAYIGGLMDAGDLAYNKEDLEYALGTDEFKEASRAIDEVLKLSKVDTPEGRKLYERRRQGLARYLKEDVKDDRVRSSLEMIANDKGADFKALMSGTGHVKATDVFGRAAEAADQASGTLTKEASKKFMERGLEVAGMSMFKDDAGDAQFDESEMRSQLQFLLSDEKKLQEWGTGKNRTREQQSIAHLAQKMQRGEQITTEDVRRYEREVKRMGAHSDGVSGKDLDSEMLGSENMKSAAQSLALTAQILEALTKET